MLRILLLVRGAYWRATQGMLVRAGKGRVRLAAGVRIRGCLNVTVGRAGTFTVGKDSLIDQRTVMTAEGNLEIGSGCFIGMGTILGCKESLRIGDRVAIGPSCVIIDTNKNYSDLAVPILDQGSASKVVFIASDVWIGAGVVILAGSSIGPHSVVAAGSVVTGEFQGGSVLGGSPARILRTL